ncbi:MAG: HAD-IA family hydrolase [Gammaproteobacteria bacterium]|jgi:phosphoglycolate phosphatase
MTQRFKVLIFDWDGTLMDSEAHIVQSMVSAMEQLGTEVLDARTIGNVIGLGMREAVHTLFPQRRDEAFVKAFVDAYRSHFFAADAPQALFPGAASTLRGLRADGYRLAVATGKSRRGLDFALEQTGLGDLFSATRAADETASKPDPRMLREILAELGADPDEAIMIGDTAFDMEMARNAGTHAVAVSYGVHDTARLMAYRPLTCLDELAALSQWLVAAAVPKRVASAS